MKNRTRATVYVRMPDNVIGTESHSLGPARVFAL
jgi:hypothetical protein